MEWLCPFPKVVPAPSLQRIVPLGVLAAMAGPGVTLPGVISLSVQYLVFKVQPSNGEQTDTMPQNVGIISALYNTNYSKLYRFLGQPLVYKNNRQLHVGSCVTDG